MAAIAVVALLHRTILLTYSDPQFRLPYDHWKYIHMAVSNPLDFHIAPFCWRIGLPLLVKIMPFGIQSNFLIVATVATIGSAVATYYIGKQWGFPIPLALTGMLLFLSVSYATKNLLRDFWRPDPLAILFITVIIYCILARKDTLAGFLLASGVLVKESVIFVAPLYYTLNAGRPWDRRMLARFALLVAPAIAMLLLVRILIPEMNGDPNYLQTLPFNLKQVHNGMTAYSYPQEFMFYGSKLLHSFGLHVIYGYTIGTFGLILVLFPFLDFKRNAVLSGKMLPFLLLVYSQVSFASEATRYLVLATPALIILTLNGMQRAAQVLNLPLTYALGLPALFVGLDLLRLDYGDSPHYVLQVVTLVAYVVLAVGIGKIIAPRVRAGRIARRMY